MDFATVIIGTLIANALTAAFIYSLWRLKRNEKDGGAQNILLLVCAIVIGVSIAGGLALKEQRQTQAHQEHAGSPQR